MYYRQRTWRKEEKIGNREREIPTDGEIDMMFSIWDRAMQAIYGKTGSSAW